MAVFNDVLAPEEIAQIRAENYGRKK